MAQKVLRFTQDEMAARVEVAQQGGRVIHQFSPTAFVAELPDAVDLMSLAKSTAQPTQPLDVVTQLAVTAWTTVQADKRARAVAAPSPTEGLPWDTPGFEPPREFGTSVAAARAGVDTEVVAESTGTPTSLYMIGSVAVGLVLVSRNIGGEVLTDAERTTIVQEVQEGLDWLVGVEPRARVSFIYDIRPVTVSSAPGPYPGVTDPYERFERDWRDAALAAMGYAAGRPGYQQYANDLRSSRQTDWAYVAFFTKYALQHFAYAVNEKVVMNYANDGWGPDNINRVFAHESCHIFGAADEYGSCVCGSASGHLGVPNNNCVNCFPPGAQVPCLMNATHWRCASSAEGKLVGTNGSFQGYQGSSSRPGLSYMRREMNSTSPWPPMEIYSPSRDRAVGPTRRKCMCSLRRIATSSSACRLGPHCIRPTVVGPSP